MTRYNKAIRKARRSSQRRYCPEMSVVSGTANQVTNRVSTITLPGQQSADSESALQSSLSHLKADFMIQAIERVSRTRAQPDA
jgi:hypothetical protein